MAAPVITLHAPDTNVPAFAEAGFPFERFLGTWHVRLTCIARTS